jgi:hypothetical protein
MNRIIFKDNTTLIDKSVELDNFKSGSHSQTIVAAEDAIYIGSDYPCTDLYFKIDTTSTATATVSVSVWDSGNWKETAEVIDETSLNGWTLGKSGHVSFTPSKEYNWVKESTNYAGESVTDLTSVKLYDKFWSKWTFSANLSPVVISFIGIKFCDDDDLAAEYPDLNRSDVKAAWQTGKTTWDEQAIIISEMVARDLMEKKVIDNQAQLLDRREIKRIAVAKLAEVIFNGMGTDYVDSARLARETYTKRVSSWMPRKVDIHQKGRIDNNEQLRFGRMIR